MNIYITVNYGGGTIYWTNSRVNTHDWMLLCTEKLYLIRTHFIRLTSKPGSVSNYTINF